MHHIQAGSNLLMGGGGYTSVHLTPRTLAKIEDETPPPRSRLNF